MDSNIVDIILDELVRTATDGGIGTQRCETISHIVALLSSINVRGRIYSKLRKVWHVFIEVQYDMPLTNVGVEQGTAEVYEYPSGASELERNFDVDPVVFGRWITIDTCRSQLSLCSRTYPPCVIGCWRRTCSCTEVGIWDYCESSAVALYCSSRQWPRGTSVNAVNQRLQPSINSQAVWTSARNSCKRIHQ